MRGRAVILTHPHKQRGEAKGRSAVADLHSWQPENRPVIREGTRERERREETKRER